MNIEQLFPTPLLHDNLGRELTEEEADYLSTELQNMKQNLGNMRSVNKFILDDPSMKAMKDEFEVYLNRFARHIFGIHPDCNVEFYITTSWLNEARDGGFHPEHDHRNSVLSGVFYPMVPEGGDRIVLNQSRNHWTYQMIDFDCQVWNEFSSPIRTELINQWDYIMFPSMLGHFVPSLQGEWRVSLAFNAWFRGEIGGDETNYLKGN